jgi:aspartyl-tRNA(Asn)/glutamyl-tRNA(Gln) amidotransferase subunit A
VGLKPSYGLVSRSGVVAMASSLDCIGPITKNVQDNALILDIIAGQDQLDSTTINRDKTGYMIDANSQRQVEKAKIGVISDYLIDGIDQKVKTNFLAKVELLKQAGFQVEDISVPLIKYALAVYYIICPAEVSSNLSRYDGQRYGYHDPKAEDLLSSYVKSRGVGFGKEAKRRIMIGTHVLSSGYYDAYYKKAQIVRSKMIEQFNQAFKEVDYLLGPVAPTTAFKIGERSNNPLEMYLSDAMTVAANLVGVPAASLPIGLDSQNLQICLQFIAQKKKDIELLVLALRLSVADMGTGHVNGSPTVLDLCPQGQCPGGQFSNPTCMALRDSRHR